MTGNSSGKGDDKGESVREAEKKVRESMRDVGFHARDGQRHVAKCTG